MIGYRFEAGCLNCGGTLTHTTSGTTGTFSARAVATCTRCDLEHLIITTIAVDPGKVKAARARATRELQPA